MAFNCWIAFLFLFLVPVYSITHTSQTMQNCCKSILNSSFPPEQYTRLKSYQQIPAHGKCPPLIQFKFKKGLTFCATRSVARPLMEAIDARQFGPSKDVPSAGARKGSKMIHPSSSPGEFTHPHGTGMSTPLTEAPRGQDTSTILPSVPPSPPSTDAYRHDNVQMSSFSVVPVPGLQELDRITMPSSVPPSLSSTDIQERDSVQMSSSSTQALSGLQALDGITTPPSVPPSLPSTDAQEHDSVQMSSSSTQALLGLQGLDGITMPPSVPPSLSSTDTQERDSVQMSSSSTQALSGLQALDGITTSPSVPPSLPSTDAQERDSVQMFSSSTQAPPGLQRLDSRPTPPSVPPSPVAAASQGTAGPHVPISSATALPGPQSQGATSTLQTTQALPSTEQPPQEDVTTAQLMKATEMTSPHPENNMATAVTPAPRNQVKQQSKSGGHINIHKVCKGHGESRGQRLRVGLALAIFLISVATALLCVSRCCWTIWIVPQERRNSKKHRNSDTVDLMCYQNVYSDLV